MYAAWPETSSCAFDRAEPPTCVLERATSHDGDITLTPLADERLTAFIESFNAQALPPASEIGVARLRAAAADRAVARPKGPEMHEIRELSIPPHAVAARLYRPSAGPLPMVVYLHGGGWVIGDLETHDRACRRLAAASRAAVLAVDYRRAPEHPCASWN